MADLTIDDYFLVIGQKEMLIQKLQSDLRKAESTIQFLRGELSNISKHINENNDNVDNIDNIDKKAKSNT